MIVSRPRPNGHPRRRDPRRATLLAAVAGALLLAGLAYLALTAANGLPLRRYYYLEAEFANAAGLDVYSDVRIAGELVGQVRGASLHYGRARVTLQLNQSAAPLRAGTTARIRLQGLLGARYVQLTPGRTGPELRSGATLPVSRTSTSVDVFDVLSTFDAKRRVALRATLGGLGQGFLGRGAGLNQALSHAPALVASFDATAAAVNSRPGAAQRLVPGAESLAAALDPVRHPLAEGLDPEARSLQPFSDERGSVQATLAEAPAALAAIRLGLAQTDPLLSQTRGLSRGLVALTGPAPAALRSATTLLRSAGQPLRRTRPLLTSLNGAIPPALQLLRAAAPLAAPAARTLGNAIPGLFDLGAYGCDVSGWARNWYETFQLGSPPQTSAGLTGLIRLAYVVNSSLVTDNRPGTLHARYYEPPCAAESDRAP